MPPRPAYIPRPAPVNLARRGWRRSGRSRVRREVRSSRGPLRGGCDSDGQGPGPGSRGGLSGSLGSWGSDPCRPLPSLLSRRGRRGAAAGEMAEPELGRGARGRGRWLLRAPNPERGLLGPASCRGCPFPQVPPWCHTSCARGRFAISAQGGPSGWSKKTPKSNVSPSLHTAVLLPSVLDLAPNEVQVAE